MKNTILVAYASKHGMTAEIDTAIFDGAIDVKKMSFLEKWVIKDVKAPTGDFRDRDAIGSRARAIADALKLQA